jgi:hypothetical protein
MLPSRLGRVIPASKGVMRSYDDLNSYAKTVSLCGLYAVGARKRVWKGRIKGGLMAVSLFIVTPIQYCSGYHAKLGCEVRLIKYKRG